MEEAILGLILLIGAVILNLKIMAARSTNNEKKKIID